MNARLFMAAFTSGASRMTILHQETLANGEVQTTDEVFENLAIGPAIHVPYMHHFHLWTCMLVAQECTEDTCYPGCCMKIGLADKEGNDLKTILSILAITKQWHQEGKKIMIACGAGRSRAPSITSAHMVNCGVAGDMLEAIGVIGRSRQVAPNAGIWGNVEEALKKLRSAA